MTAKRPSHNISFGPIHHCQVCASERLELIIDLGHQPLCDSLLTAEQLNGPETTYPLRLFRCLDCSLAQIDYAVESQVVYHKEYPYRSGITREVAQHQFALAAEVIKEIGTPKDSLVVDIGSNDGTLLSGFKANGMRVLGVEPTNIAKIARENGIDSIQDFFNEAVAKDIVSQHGKASIVTATNVFAHMATLGDVMRAIETVITDDGFFISESHYLPEIIAHTQYDTIYHEHLRSYSLKSLITLLEMYDFTVVDARVVNRYAGSVRVYAQRGKNRRVLPTIPAMLQAERDAGIYEKATYDRFRERAMKSRDDLLSLAMRARERGERLVGNSCPGRSSTLLNYSGITRDLMPYIGEQPTSLKLGLYLPGKHIPIVMNQRLIDEQPDYVVLLAWHYAEPIMAELRGRGLKSKLVVPLPELKIIEH